MKTNVSQRYALSCKFKGNWIEVSIQNKETGSMKIELIPIFDDEISEEDKNTVLGSKPDVEDQKKEQEEPEEVSEDGN